MKKLLASSVLLILLASCATQTFAVNPKVKREIPEGEPHYSSWSHFFIGGIGQSDFREPVSMCKQNDGIAFVQVKQDFSQVIISGITMGIYTPRTMSVYCNK